MAVFDFKKDRKDLYQPATAPVIVDVPAMLFLMVDGTGNPNMSQEFANAMGVLYGLSYTIRMNKAESGYFPYVVAPLEGFWSLPGGQLFAGDGPVRDKDGLQWTVCIRQPAFVTPQVFAVAQTALARKKPELDPASARLETYTEGLCVQALHVGPYDTEPATIQAMRVYLAQRGFAADCTPARRHHEIYLSNPRAVAPERLKTILRIPVKRR